MANYSAIVLNGPSRAKLQSIYEEAFGIFDWRIICHHMTLNMGKLSTKHDLKLGDYVQLKVLQIGKSDKAAAVKVIATDLYHSGSLLATHYVDLPHVTLAVNPDGGKPVHSRDIAEWEDLDSVKFAKFANKDGNIYVTGVVQEVE